MASADLLTPPAPLRRDPSPRLWTDAEFARMRQLDLFAGREVELVGGTVVERPAGVPFVFTRKEYYALGDNHFFRDQRVQLIGGVILQESPMNPPHATAVSLGQAMLPVAFAANCHVRVQLPIDFVEFQPVRCASGVGAERHASRGPDTGHNKPAETALGLISEPHPDLAVVTGSPRDYLVEHPKAALLVVEVSDSTFEEDTHDKASLYATGGIEDYWVIDLTTDRVLVFRSPKPDPKSKFGKDYASVSAHGRDDKLTPLAAPNARVLVSDLLP